MPKRAVLIALAGGLFTLACNLVSTTSLTPTPQPVQPTQALTSAAPTLFASITPLGNVGGGTAPTQAPSNTCTPPAGWVPYTIEDGDSLAALAQATSTSVQTVVQANCLTDADTIYTGQTIYLPSNPISG